MEALQGGHDPGVEVAAGEGVEDGEGLGDAAGGTVRPSVSRMAAAAAAMRSRMVAGSLVAGSAYQFR